METKRFDRKERDRLIEEFAKYDSVSIHFLELAIDGMIKQSRQKRYEMFKDIHPKFDMCRNTIRVEDLMLEEYFPCDLIVTNWTGWWQCNDYCDFAFMPMIIPKESKVMRMMINRAYTEKEKEEKRYLIERIMLWYTDGVIDFNPLYDEDETCSTDLANIILHVMKQWTEPLSFDMELLYNNECPKELWIGYDYDINKFVFKGKETKRFIRIFDNLRFT